MGKNNLSVGHGGGCLPVLRHGRRMRGFAGNALVNRFFPLRNRGSNPPGFLRMRRFPVTQQQRRNSKKRRISDGCRSGFRATSRFFPARSCAERSFALSLTAHERPVVGFHALFLSFSQSNKRICGVSGRDFVYCKRPLAGRSWAVLVHDV